jgi:hypothetical protein
MMAAEIYRVWAPAGATWSDWAAPVLFADLHDRRGGQPEAEPPVPAWIGLAAGGDAVVLDLPGAAAVIAGIALAERGMRPVPLYNASPGPDPFVLLPPAASAGPNVVVDMRPILEAVLAATTRLERLQLAPDAAPVFLLDSERLEGQHTVAPGMFDNRWLVVPQDFPSARFLREHGITRAILVQESGFTPKEDLAHVLLRWQLQGIEILAMCTSAPAAPVPIIVERPSRFRTAWYRGLAMLGFRRNAGGGFGARVPTSSAG